MTQTSAACAFGSGFLRRGCGRPAVSDCVYCARPFCDGHGERGEEYHDVCARARCRGKLRDLRAHAEWRDRAAGSNRAGVCAIGDCGERMRHQCSRCRLLCCAGHVRERTVRDRSRGPAAGAPALVCAHCAERLRLWDRP